MLRIELQSSGNASIVDIVAPSEAVAKSSIDISYTLKNVGDTPSEIVGKLFNIDTSKLVDEKRQILVVNGTFEKTVTMTMPETDLNLKLVASHKQEVEEYFTARITPSDSLYVSPTTYYGRHIGYASHRYRLRDVSDWIQGTSGGIRSTDGFYKTFNRDYFTGRLGHGTFDFEVTLRDDLYVVVGKPIASVTW